jgi:hypothetical protein
MKTEGQVRHKLQQVTFRHLQRTVRTALSCRPENCVNNRSVNLPLGQVRFCGVLVAPDGSALPCDDALGGVLQASRCPGFRNKNTREEVRNAFTEFLKTSDVATIATRYPDLAALLWVSEETPEVPQVEIDPPPPPPPPIARLYLQSEGASVTYTPRSSSDHYRAVVFPNPLHWGL